MFNTESVEEMYACVWKEVEAGDETTVREMVAQFTSLGCKCTMGRTTHVSDLGQLTILPTLAHR